MFNLIPSFLILARFKTRQSIAPLILSEYSLQRVNIVSFKKQTTRKLTKLKLDLNFSWLVDYKKLYSNCEDFNLVPLVF